MSPHYSKISLGTSVALEFHYAVAFLAGILLHVFVFRVGEWDLSGPNIIATFTSIYATILTIACIYLDNETHSKWHTFKDISGFFVILLSGLYSSMLLYRAFFHPLHRFSGPFVARLSSIYPTSLFLKRFQYFEEVRKCHSIYGDFVRIGPNELSISHPAAVQAIHSNASPCSKGPWYDSQQPTVSVHSTRSRTIHTRRRKIWDRGFSTKALKNYEPRVNLYTNALITHLDTTVGNPTDVSKTFNLYSFDVMGNLAFGKDFGMVKTQTWHPAMSLLHSSAKIVGVFSHFNWMFHILKKIPGATGEFARFMKWLEGQIGERMDNEPDVPDVFSWILDDYKGITNPTKQDTLDLQGDALLIVVAGSDTTAATLTCLIHELALHPESYAKLQSEVDSCWSDTGELSHTDMAKLPYLQACIDESLRLHSAIPPGMQRQTPPQGLQIGETYVPGNVLVQIPLHTLYHDERVFSYPDEFLPERWTSKRDLVKNGSVFAPFSIGRYSCVGKQLGLMEIRNVICQIARRYDIRLKDSKTSEIFLSKIVDAFTMACPELEVVFTPRRGEM